MPRIGTGSNKYAVSDKLNDHFDETPALVDIMPSIAAHLKLDIPADIINNLDGTSFIDK